MFKTLTTLLLLSSTAAWAHDGAAAGQFGGQVAAAGDWHVEFAVRDGGVRVWVRDHGDKPVAATGKVTLLAGGQKLDVALKSDGEALVADAAALQSAAKVTAVLALTVAGKPVSARFAQEAVVKPALSPSAQAGAKVFGEICFACHGTALRGSDAGPPLLHPYYAPGAGHGDEVVLAAIANGAASHHWKFGDMPKPEGIKPGQDKDLLAYIRAMQAANGLGAAAPMDHSAHAMH
ncbi:MAG: cytochrome c [Magnetospirillum sp.]|nr:cytochrome c [Magnetospirillum sp.]